MKTWVVVLVLSMVVVPSILGHGEEKTGILVDAKCGASLVEKESDAEAHRVTCALDSREHGFGIIVDGKFLRFDDYGNKQALLLLKATQKQSNLKVRVGGHFEGDLAKVSELETVE